MKKNIFDFYRTKFGALTVAIPKYMFKYNNHVYNSKLKLPL